MLNSFFEKCPQSSLILWGLSISVPFVYIAAYLAFAAIRNADLPVLFLLQPILCLIASIRIKANWPVRISLFFLTVIVSKLVWLIGIRFYYGVASGFN